MHTKLMSILPVNIIETLTDSCGRVALGSEFADDDVVAEY